MCSERLCDVAGGNKSSSSALSGGAIAGIVIGVVAGVILLLIVAFFLCTMTRSSKAREPGSTRLEEESSHVSHDVESHDGEEMEMQTV